MVAMKVIKNVGMRPAEKLIGVGAPYVVMSGAGLR